MCGTKELWKPVAEYEGLYEVSNLGRVKSVQRFVVSQGVKRTRKNYIMKEKILKQFNSHGYLRVCLTKNGISKFYLVHRLVLESFIGPCPQGCETRHLNNDPSDNRLINLCYGTHSENTIDKSKCGHHPKRKLSNDQVVDIYMRYKNGSCTKTELANEYGVWFSTINQIVKGKNYSWLTQQI